MFFPRAALEQVQRQGLMGEYAVPDGNLGRLGVPGATFAVGFRDPRGCAEVPLLSGRLVCSDIGRVSTWACMPQPENSEASAAHQPLPKLWP